MKKEKRKKEKKKIEREKETKKEEEYNTIQLYCLCVEKFAFWLVIYIKLSIHFTIKHQQFNKTRS